MVKASSARYAQGLDIAAARNRLMALRRADVRANRLATIIRWLVRTAAILLVPALLTYQVLTATSWFSHAWDSIGSRALLLLALALGVVAAFWTFVVTRPENRRRLGARSKAESHAIRSLLAGEQFAVRLAVGIARSTAWGAVSLTNHFPAGSAIPARAVEEALVLVGELRRVGRRRHLRPVRRRIAVVAIPLVTCLVPASVIILLL